MLQGGPDSPTAARGRQAAAAALEESVITDDAVLLDGDDWRESPYAPPSIHLARAKRRQVMFKGGVAPLWRTTHEDMGKMSEGLGMYLSLTHNLCLLFTAMSVVALPSIIVSTTGRSALLLAADAPGYEAPTVGCLAGEPVKNVIAVVPTVDTNVSFVSVVNPSTQLYVPLNLTRSLSILGAEWMSGSVASLVAGCDLTATLLFIAYCSLLQWRKFQARQRTLQTSVMSSDYTAFVTHLPPETTKRAVRDHFNRL